MQFFLNHPEARRRAMAAVAEADAGWVVTVKEPTRSSLQNALLHSLIGEIAAEIEWAGKKRDVEVWKRLLVAAWLRARGTSVEVLPALDGHGIDVVYAPTHKMTKAELSELVEYVSAFKAEHEVTA